MGDEKQPLLIGGNCMDLADVLPVYTAQHVQASQFSSAPARDLTPPSDPSPKHEYDPKSERNLEHPTSNVDTLIHLLKGNIGTGILAMPDAFKNAGWVVGIFGTLIMGAICTHCMHMLVECSHELCIRNQRPALSFSEVVEDAFLSGPIRLRPYAKRMKTIVNAFLCITQLGFCCVYFLFVATNLQDAMEYFHVYYNIHWYLLFLLLPLMMINTVKSLKYLTPISLIASLMTAWGLAITFHYLLKDLPKMNTIKAFSSWHQLPLYFGTAIYAFEGIGVVLPLENNMKTPESFGGWNGVLNTGMVIVACLYVAVGFFGYLKYGDAVQGSITLNLPSGQFMAQSVRAIMAAAIFLSYGLQFYVPMNIIWPWVKQRLNSEKALKYGELATRLTLIIITFSLVYLPHVTHKKVGKDVLVYRMCRPLGRFLYRPELCQYSVGSGNVTAAAMIPNLSGIISLVGAVSSSTLALIFPPIIEIITLWPDGLGTRYWKLWKDLGIMIFGIVGFLFGSYASLENILTDTHT